MPVANGSAGPSGAALEADPDTKTDVDFMILDYLASIAAERILRPVDNSNPDTEQEIDWLVDSVRAFQTVVVTAQSEASLPKDVDIKLQILHVADALRVYTPVPASGRSPRLSSIGLEFMDLCTKAIPRVSENRWFDIGAQFLIQAAVEEPREGNTPTDMLHQFSKFSAWTPSDRSRISKWMRVRQRYISELPGPGEFSSSRASLIEKFPFMEFKASVLGFLFDLMATLDAPLLIQLERGQVGQLSRAETQRLKERIGMH